ncbi:hypothetical protein JZK55_00250 [Dissulfurispira thermophila]|uniref:Uncharacterized protein n=2 Tax=root TaxID=1 RepID=A0A7G1GYW9_9BACT|nr:hypothetical protein [Dissulfurispira thermophila]BCB95103.1 hypothetical protein JZK55_00250 [Dissulfurispira thermophila]
MAEKTNGVCWRSIIILSIFCIMAGFGGGITVQNVLSGGNHAAWVSVGYGIVAGVFIAISVVIFKTVLSSLKQQ